MKNTPSELAIYGGTPAFTDSLHVGRPNIGNRSRLLERINDMLDRHWLTNDGKYVQEFEKNLAEYLGVRHCIPMGCNPPPAPANQKDAGEYRDRWRQGWSTSVVSPVQCETA